MKAKLFISGEFSHISIANQMNTFFKENPDIKIEAIEYKVNQRIVDNVLLDSRECLLIYRDGVE